MPPRAIMRREITCGIFIMLGAFTFTAKAAITQPDELEQLLLDGNYEEFEKIARVPERISKYIELDYPKVLELNSHPLGDIMLVAEQYDEVDGESVPNGVLLDKWVKEIPYAILNVNYTADDIATIEELIDSYNSHFVGVLEFRPQTPTDEDYVAIFNGNGCFTHLGKLGGVQAMSLRPGLDFSPCLTPGLMHHEMTHTLGFVHTNNRADRDFYIMNHPDKFPKGMEYLYGAILPNASTADPSKLYVEIMGPYRYDSLMHLPASFGPVEGYEGPFFDLLRTSEMNVSIADIGNLGIMALTPLDIQMVKNAYADLNHQDPDTAPPS